MAENNFSLRIICPDRVFYEGEAHMLELNTMEGEVGIYKNHVPMTMIIAPGPMTITPGEGEKKVAALHAGFIEVLPDRITVMAEVAEWPDEIDVKRAEDAKDRAQRRIQEHKADVDIARAEAALSRALTRIYVAK